jgi:uncharacterized protein (DUF1810 family)
VNRDDQVHGLERFVDAQDAGGAFTRAFDELAAGRKASHWMWFVFPQLAGLGSSDMARRYAPASVAEATAYLSHPVLGPRLFEVTGLVLAVPDRTADDVFGAVDSMKLRSSMTLFHRAGPDEPLFTAVLDRYFDGSPDPATDQLLGRG